MRVLALAQNTGIPLSETDRENARLARERLFTTQLVGALVPPMEGMPKIDLEQIHKAIREAGFSDAQYAGMLAAARAQAQTLASAAPVTVTLDGVKYTISAEQAAGFAANREARKFSQADEWARIRHADAQRVLEVADAKTDQIRQNLLRAEDAAVQVSGQVEALKDRQRVLRAAIFRLDTNIVAVKKGMTVVEDGQPVFGKEGEQYLTRRKQETSVALQQLNQVVDEATSRISAAEQSVSYWQKQWANALKKPAKSEAPKYYYEVVP
jgi:chromosome segregation ATPase